MRFPFRGKGASAGFTLLELILVLAIVAATASLSVLAVGRLREATLFKDSLREVQGSLRRAKLTALQERVPVLFKAQGSAFWLEKEAARMGGVNRMPEGSSIKAETTIVFFPKGNSTGGSIHIRDPKGRSYKIEVDRITGVSKFEGP